MPLVRISLRDDTAPEVRRAIADGVHDALVATVGIPAGDRFQIIDQRPADGLVFDPGYLGIARENVVFVEISLVRGRTAEKKQALYQGIADRLAAVGLRPEDVFVVLNETGREDWSLGGGVAQLLDTELLNRHGWTPPSE